MRNHNKFALSTVAGLGLAALLAAPAMAADVVYEEPPAPAPVEIAPLESQWSGPYAGVTLGRGFSGSVDEPGNEIETEGWMGGAFGGYQMQNGMFVYGAEADINYSGVDGVNGGVEARSRVDGSLRARAGVAVTNDILLYGTAGGAAERLRLTEGGVDDTNVALGYTVGAGVDAKLTDQVFGRVEYRYTDYGSETFNFGGADREFDSSNNRVNVGLGIQF